jgi:hypothetical protein
MQLPTVYLVQRYERIGLLRLGTALYPQVKENHRLLRDHQHEERPPNS